MPFWVRKKQFQDFKKQKCYNLKVNKKIIKTIIIVAFFSLPILNLYSQQQAAVEKKINDGNNEIKKLEQEIARYQLELANTAKQTNSLQTEVNRLETTRKKLEADIRLTNTKIENSKLKIDQLTKDIASSNSSIETNQENIREVLRKINQNTSSNTLLIPFEYNSLSEYFNYLSQLEKLSKELDQRVNDLKNIKQNQESNKKQQEIEKTNLESLIKKLADQKIIAEDNQKEKNNLLAQTKNQEANYKKILEDRQKRKNQIEEEIRLAQESLKVNIDPGKIPSSGKGILKWPVDSVRITQYFGFTQFATANSQIYNGRGHNGIDLGAAVGTPIKAARQGVVIGTGDTDLTCKGASYGKWVLIEHDNGLSTVYAHLSLIKVKEGQKVATGEVVAYSGNTGYTTGPHLHFSVFSSQGIKVSTLQSKVPGCGVYRLPLAPNNSVLNPLSYL